MRKLSKIFRNAPRRSIAAVLIGALLIHMLVVGSTAIIQFEDRRWDVPAGVYAAPLELYAGLPIGAPNLSATLDQLGFQQVDDVAQPGHYSIEPERVTLWTRAFRFLDQVDPAAKYVLQNDGDGIRSL